MTRMLKPALAATSLAFFAAAAAAQTPAPAPPQPATSQPAGAISGAVKLDDSGAYNRADPAMQQVLEALHALGARPVETLTPEEARRQPTIADAAAEVLKKAGKNPDEVKAKLGVRTQDGEYEAADGGRLPMRVYTPEGLAPGAMLPVALYFHGGGWVVGDIDSYDAGARALAKTANAVVISVDYRRAPEHKFPAAHEDAVAAYKWAIGNAARWGGDSRRIAVAGESAGGNLAIHVAIAARDQKLPAPAHMLLIYPVAGTDMTTPSYKENENARPLSKAAMQWFFKQYFSSEKDAASPMIDVVGKANLKGLPDATVITADIDPLMSEGKQLVDKLREAGADVKYQNVMGATHEFFGLGAVLDGAAQANVFAGQELKKAFAAQETGSTGREKEKK